MELDGFPAVDAMCAIDALGIPAMAGRDGRIAAADLKTAPRSSFRRGAGSGLCAVAAGVEGGVRAHLAASDWIEGETLSQEDAVNLGKRIFGALLGGPA